MLDLDALAAEVAAVLDRHGLNRGECQAELYPTLQEYLVTADPPHGWQVWVQIRDAGMSPRLSFEGTVTPASFAVLRAVYARVHGEE
jgi:hypothetical protein